MITLALLAAACTAVAPGGQPGAPPARPALTGAHPCPGRPGFTCSYLAVPLDRSGKVPGVLRLQVAAAGNTHARLGTLLFLTGGPGQPGVQFVGPVAHELAPALRAYRLVMIDQRGTGGGSLNCPGLQQQMGESDTLPPTAQAVRSCAQTLGARRDFFTTADTVADLDSLRQAMHLRSWTLDGASYGTFTAEEYALAHPGRVRLLVLDSVVPQQNVDPLYIASMHRAAFVLRQACRLQHCRYDPAAELARVIARYGYSVRIFDIMVILSIIDPRLSSPRIGFLARLHTAAHGNPGPLRALINGFYGGPGVRPQTYSSGLHAATLCADIPDMPWGNAAVPLAGRKDEVLRSNDVETGGVLGRADRKRQALAVGQALEVDLDHFAFFRAVLRPFFAGGPFAARSSIRRTASSSVTASGCAPLDSVRSSACVTVAARMSAAATAMGGRRGASVDANGPAVAAATAIGAEKPTSSEVQPAR